MILPSQPTKAFINNNNYIPYILTHFIRDEDGEKYITLGSMSIILDCNPDELCEVLYEHRNQISKYLIDASSDDKIRYNNKMTLEGWIRFLSLQCFILSNNIVSCLSIMKEAIS